MKATVFFLVLVNGAMVLATPAIEWNNKAPPSASGYYPLCVKIDRSIKQFIDNPIVQTLTVVLLAPSASVEIVRAL